MSLIFDILNYKFCQIKYSKFEIPKVYTINFQRIEGIRKFEFVAKTQFLYKVPKWLYHIRTSFEKSENSELIIISPYTLYLGTALCR